MLSREATGTAIVLASWLMLGCSQTMSRPPEGWVHDDDTAQRLVRGSDVTLWLRRQTRDGIQGELIAVIGDTLHVLTPSGLERVALRDLRSSRLEVIDAGGRSRVLSNLRTIPDLARYSRFPAGWPPGFDAAGWTRTGAVSESTSVRGR